MFRIFSVIAFAFLSSVPAFAAAPAAPETPQTFLQGIYSQYLGKGSKGVAINTDADWHRYFTDGLAALIIADEKKAAKTQDIPTLDGDPFIDAQDWGMSHLSIHIDSQSATSATATVKFDNLDDHNKVLHLKLLTTSKGWRIDDIVWPGTEGTFRGLYKK
jgi:hypothetical protein